MSDLHFLSIQIEKMLEMEQKIVSLSSRIEQLEQEKEVLQKRLRSAEHSHSMKMLSLQQEYDPLVKDLKQRVSESRIVKFRSLHTHTFVQREASQRVVPPSQNKTSICMYVCILYYLHSYSA